MFMLARVPTAPPPASAGFAPTTWWVSVGGSDSNSGTSSVEPFKTITHALSVAAFHDTVKIMPGVYNAANGETFPLTDTGQTLQSTDGTATTVLDAEGASTVMYLMGNLDGVEIQGLTIRNGRSLTPGGGIYVFSTSGTATDSPLFVGNHFENNATGANGGAISLYSDTHGVIRPRIEANVFASNAATSGTGGTVVVSGFVSPTVVGNDFVDNQAGVAGALFVPGFGGEVHDNDFDGNSAGQGGALQCNGSDSATLTISGNRFYDNNCATGRGGALYLYHATVLLTGNDAGGNETYSDGGFACCDSSTVTAVNNAIGGSHGPGFGSAWFVTGGVFRETNDDVVSSSEGLSAICATAGADATVTNCILWNPDLPTDIEGASALSHSCVHDTEVASKDNTLGAGVMFADPVFADPAAHTVDLAATSPCIDTADTAMAPDSDIYGTARPIDGNGDGVAQADIGAFERKTDTVLTFSAPSVCSYRSAKVTGTLKTKLGHALPALPVRIEYSYDDWSTIAGYRIVMTTASGAYSSTYAPMKKTYYRARFLGDSTRLASNRVSRVVLPRVFLTRPSATSPMHYGTYYRVTGYLKPRHTAGTKPVRILLYRYRGGRWVYQSKHYHATVSNYSTYSKYRVSIKLPYRGTWRLKAYHPADSLNAATRSTYRTVTVR